MALIKCKECGKDISDTTDICIHCGAPTSISLNDKVDTRPKRRSKHGIFIFIGIIILVFVILVIPFLINFARMKAFMVMQ